MHFKRICLASCSKTNFLNGILKKIRIIYIAFAISFVCYGYYTTLMMAKEGYRYVQDEVSVKHKHRYPSITFCYVFNHNQKHVWTLYYLHLFEQWKRTDTRCLLKNIEHKSAAVINIQEVEYQRGKHKRGAICTKMCNDHPECDVWTQYFGSCYLKTEGVFKHKRITPNGKFISGTKYCRSTGSHCVYEDYDFYGGDIAVKKSSNYRDCQKRCEDHKLCKKWTFNTFKNFSGKCYLLKRANESVDMIPCKNRCLTGIKNNTEKYCGTLAPLIDFNTFWKDYLYNRTAFLSSVQQRFSLNQEEYEMIDEEQHWTVSIPHESSDPCYTYDPPQDSDPGHEAGLYITMKSTKKWDSNLSIYLHKKGKFFYQSNFEANTQRIHLSQLKSVKSGRPKITLRDHTNNKITSRDEPCIDDLNYDYYRCYESYLYKKRGCQYPWNVYKDLEVPICSNFTQTEKMLFNLDKDLGGHRFHFRHTERLTRTKMECPRPCQYTSYDLQFSKSGSFSGSKVDGVKENSLQIGYTDFRFVNYKEYPACDLTCIIGQLGGNLGFFLGGSILAVVDFSVNVLSNLLRNSVET